MSTHDDIDLCMIYDSFTITVLATLENLGFCKVGEGGASSATGASASAATLPVNPDGGGLSSTTRACAASSSSSRRSSSCAASAAPVRCDGARLACVHGTGGTLGVAHSGATLILGSGVDEPRLDRLPHPLPYASWETRG